MTVGIIVLILICIILLMIANAIKNLHKLIEEKVNIFSRAVENPSEVALQIGAKVASGAVKKVKEAITRKHKSEE